MHQIERDVKFLALPMLPVFVIALGIFTGNLMAYIHGASVNAGPMMLITGGLVVGTISAILQLLYVLKRIEKHKAEPVAGG